MHDVKIKDKIYAYYLSSNTNCQQFSVSNGFKVVHYAFLIQLAFYLDEKQCMSWLQQLVWNTKLHYSITLSVLVTDLSIAILPVCFWLHRTERLLCSNKLWHIAYNGNRQYNTSGSKLWTLLPLYRSAITSTYSIYDNHQWHQSNLQFLNYKCNIEAFSWTYIVKSFERNNTHNTGLKDPNFA